MADTTTPVVGDTGGQGDVPQILNPVTVPDVNPGAFQSPIPEQLHSLLPLWVGNVPDVWRQMGLAVPGCGGRLRTAHPDINYLFSRVAEHTQAVLFHQCARIDRWPELDVLLTMHQCYINARDLLNSTLIVDGKARPRPTIPGAQSIPFRAYAMPFYGPYVRNEQIKLWAARNMELMTLLIASDENGFSYGFSQQFVNAVAVPLRTNYVWMLVNLLKVAPATVTDAYVATDADFAAYAAAKVSAGQNLANNQGSIDPLWQPSPNDKAWCVGAYTYLEAAPLLRIWNETAAPAVPTLDGQNQSSGQPAAATTAQQGAIQTT